LETAPNVTAKGIPDFGSEAWRETPLHIRMAARRSRVESAHVENYASLTAHIDARVRAPSAKIFDTWRFAVALVVPKWQPVRWGVAPPAEADEGCHEGARATFFANSVVTAPVRG
jgi:hypothetical protein